MLNSMPETIVTHILTFIVCPDDIVDKDSFLKVKVLSRKFSFLAETKELWQHVPLFVSRFFRRCSGLHSLAPLDTVEIDDSTASATLNVLNVGRSSHACGRLNHGVFKLIKIKCSGTEGVCYRVYCRPHQREYALKRARVLPENQGLPYYLMRELAALKKMNHSSICEPIHINLEESKLYILFQYIELNLHNVIYPMEEGKGIHISRDIALHFLTQLFTAMAFVHKRGILHRNLKPKHLLIIPGIDGSLVGATLKVADFALARIISFPTKEYTSEVVTRWYRSPEILLGKRNYNSAVDIWSIGTIFAEMLIGAPIFPGLSEIDQLFRIFNLLGTPHEETWSELSTLPNYQSNLFPFWEKNRIQSVILNAHDEDLDLLNNLLCLNPEKRITAIEALQQLSLAGIEGDNLSGGNSSVNSSGRALASTFLDQNCQELAQVKFLQDATGLPETAILQFLFLRDLESKLPDYNDYRASIEWKSANQNRSTIIELMIAIMDTFSEHMCQRTIFFAITLIDRFLFFQFQENNRRNKNNSTPKNTNNNHPNNKNGHMQHEHEHEHKHEHEHIDIELLGITCMHIASKCEDVSYLALEDLASGNLTTPPQIFNPADILRTEEMIMNSLDFDLYLPTTIDFLMIFLEGISVISNDECRSFVSYLAEATLANEDFNFIQLKPSHIAASIISYCLHCLEQDITWHPTIELFLHYKENDAISCIRQIRLLHLSLNDVRNAENIIRKRYLKIENHAVAFWEIPTI